MGNMSVLTLRKGNGKKYSEFFFCLFVQFFRFVFEICIKHTENNRVAKSYIRFFFFFLEKEKCFSLSHLK